MSGGSTKPGSERGPVARLLAREAALLRETVTSTGERAARLWAARPPPRRAWAMAFLAGAAAAAAASVLSRAALADRLPSPRDWDAVRTVLERDARPGDAVLVEPAWAERARAVLPPAAPVLLLDSLEGEDLLGVRRVWVLALASAPLASREREAALLLRGSLAGPPVRTGALELSRVDLTYAAVPLAFLPDHLSRASVSLGDVPCPASNGAFRCPGAAPVTVAREVREIGGAPRPCIAVSAPRGLPAPLVLAFPAAVVGRVIRGRAGSLLAPALPAPLRVSVRISDEEVGTEELSGGGFLPFRADSVRFAGFSRPVSLALTTPGVPARFCLDAATLP